VYNKKEARGQYIKNRLNNGKYAYEDYVTHIGKIINSNYNYNYMNWYLFYIIHMYIFI